MKLGDNDFQQWRAAKNQFILFFDGASKGNPGVAGAGWILFDPGGNSELYFAWGIGVATNNEAEALAALQGLQLVLSHGVKKALVVGDSSIIIRFLMQLSIPQNIGLIRLVQRSLDLVKRFERFHSSRFFEAITLRSSIASQIWEHN